MNGLDEINEQMGNLKIDENKRSFSNKQEI